MSRDLTTPPKAWTDSTPSVYTSTLSAGNNSTENKSLSKSLLYLPLIAYDSTTKSGESSDPQSFMASRKALPKNVLEKSLVEFWYKIGVEYHRNQATVHDSKNNGSRPISASEMEERIRQRALTLVGGGINTSWGRATRSRESNKDSITQSREIRKRRHRDRMDFESKEESIDTFLEQLNRLWNDYISELLHIQSIKTLSEYHALIKKTSFWVQVTSCITHETAQLVGARVQIKSCPQKRHLMGKTGYLVGISRNTWIVMMQGLYGLRMKRRKKMSNMGNDNKAEISSRHDVDAKVWKSMIVPKSGSVLSLLVPIKVEDGSALESSEAEDQKPGHSPLLIIDMKEDE